MKIVFDARMCRNRTDGIGRYNTELLKAISEIDRENRYVVLVRSDLDKTGELFRLPEDRFQRVPCSVPAMHPAQHIFIPALLERLKPDLYHYPHYDLPLPCRRPAVVTLHDLIFLNDPNYFVERKRLKTAWLKFAASRSIRRARTVIAVSEAARDDALRHFNAPREKFQVIYEAPPAGMRRVNDAAALQNVRIKYGLPETFALFVGAGRPHKNIEWLIEEHRLYRRRGGARKLAVAGADFPAYKTALGAKLKPLLDCGEAVRTGYVEEDDLAALYSMAAALVLPSRCEGFGLPAVEAMACGCPVIAARTGALAEIGAGRAELVESGKPGAIAEALLALEREPERREKRVANGLRFARSLSWHEAARRTLEVYRDCAR